MAQTQLVSTGEAARLLGIDRSTLARWAAVGAVKPASTTVGGHMRWDVAQLREQIAAVQGGGSEPR
jgi:DNA-binding transcriptional MerR regulator